MKLTSKLLILFLLISLIVLSYFGYLFSTILYLKIKFILNKNDTKYILIWLPMWNDETFSFGSDKYEPFKYCVFKNCFVTNNRSIIPIEQYNAIIFHGAQYEPSYDKPSIRKPHQRYIFGTMESPVSMQLMPLKWFGSYYNWTMTYRLDSDIIMSYGYIIQNSTNYTMPSLEFVKNKTHLVAWLVSHCYTNNKRELIYSYLNKFINIHVYGRCGNYNCPADDGDFKPSEKCYDYIAEKYKFFLAFENTHCKDYVTEKLYMLLNRNIVPIVYGFADYEHLAPPNSVIIVDKFSKMKDLADYILFLDKNPKEYLKYFEWKKSYYVATNNTRTSCTLCKMLNDPVQPQKVYENIYEWWWGKNKEYCQTEPH